MANWWDKLVAGLDQASSEGKIGYTPQYASYQPGFNPSVTRTKTSANKQPMKYTPAMTAAADKQQRDLQALGGAKSLQRNVSNELSRQAVPQAPVDPYGFDQYMADLVSMMGGSGGGVDLSGYDTMLSDVASREAGLGTRRAEQEAFLADLFGAGQTRLESDRDALEQAVQDALASDQARRATEIGLIRGDDAARLATANQAREALGVAGGEDLSSEVAQNAVAGVGAGGSVAERDARIRESIENQQIQNQIAGLIPMQQMATSSLGRNFEDRLAALASERAAIQAQMAQARSAASGRGGLSLSDILSAQRSYNENFGPGEAPEFGGILGSAQQIQQYFGPAASNVLGIANRILTSPGISQLDQTSPAEANELLGMLATSDPQVQSFLNSNPVAAAAIVNYVVQAGK